MRKIIFAIAVLFIGAIGAHAQSTLTPNIQLQIPAYNQINWQVPYNYDLNRLDSILGGIQNLPTGTSPTIGIWTNYQTSNTISTTISNLVGGYPGQVVRIICGATDSFTSISSGGNFILSAPWTCNTSSQTITLILNGTTWTELSRFGAGSGGSNLWANLLPGTNANSGSFIATGNVWNFSGATSLSIPTNVAATANAIEFDGGALQIYDSFLTQEVYFPYVQSVFNPGNCPQLAYLGGLPGQWIDTGQPCMHQSGSVVSGHIVTWLAAGEIQDGGTPGGGGETVVTALAANPIASVNASVTTVQQIGSGYAFSTGSLNTLGKSFRIQFYVQAANATGSTETVNFWLGESVSNDFLNITPVSLATSQTELLAINATCTTEATGSSGNSFCVGVAALINNNTSVSLTVPITFAFTGINLTGTPTFVPGVSFTAASTSNTGRLQQFVVEQMN